VADSSVISTYGLTAIERDVSTCLEHLWALPFTFSFTRCRHGSEPIALTTEPRLFLDYTLSLYGYFRFLFDRVFLKITQVILDPQTSTDKERLEITGARFLLQAGCPSCYRTFLSVERHRPCGRYQIILLDDRGTWLGPTVGDRLALLYIHQMNRVNSGNDLVGHDDNTINIVVVIIIITVYILLLTTCHSRGAVTRRPGVEPSTVRLAGATSQTRRQHTMPCVRYANVFTVRFIISSQM